MSRAKVSVIIPIYNIEKYLKQCLNSVVNQTLKDIEIICVDDGSTDSSAEILDDYAAKDFRIKVIHQQNSGISAATNRGLSIASGKYIFFADHDDELVEDALEYSFGVAEDEQLDVLCFESLPIFERFISDEEYEQYCIKTTRKKSTEVLFPALKCLHR